MTTAYKHTAALAHLRHVDPALGRVLDAHVVPDDFRRVRDESPSTSYFQTLCRTIVYQQLAGKAAQTIYERFLALFPSGPFPAPDLVAGMPMEKLRSVGLSERKASYLQDLARRVVDGWLALDALDTMSDQAIGEQLIAVRGIGQWTVDMFLMFQLDRKDVLPLGDLGVQKGVMTHFQLRSLPTRDQMLQLTEPWRPYRSLGSWLMWRIKETSIPPSPKRKQPNKQPAEEAATTALPPPAAPSATEPRRRSKRIRESERGDNIPF